MTKRIEYSIPVTVKGTITVIRDEGQPAPTAGELIAEATRAMDNHPFDTANGQFYADFSSAEAEEIEKYELESQELREERVHLNHCNQGEYEGSCKYGDDEGCPALTEEMMDISGTSAAADKKFIIKLTLTAYAREEELIPQQIRELMNGADVAFEYGRFFRNRHGIFIQLPGSNEKISVSSDEAISSELIPALKKFSEI